MESALAVNYSKVDSSLTSLQPHRKSSIKPSRGLFNFGHSRGGLLERGLIRKGGLFKKLDEEDIYDSFISLFNSYFADSRCSFTSQIHKFDRFLSQTISKLTCKGF